MDRIAIEPRPDWQRTVEEAGLVWHTASGQPYWNESAYYRFRAAQIDEIEAATAELQRLFLEAGQYVIDHNLFQRFGIPDWVVPFIKRAWDEEPAALFHGRFDLGYDGTSPPKLFEYNADTPTALVEASVVQWQWLEAVMPFGHRSDQFNSLHDKLVATWRSIAPYLKSRLLHFAHVNDEAGEDTLTVTYLRDTAVQAGLTTVPIFIDQVGWDPKRRRFVDMDNMPIDVLFHLYPWEWLVNEKFGPHIAECYDAMNWIEPIWKMLWSNKAILPVLWEMFPDHPNLLPAFFEPPASGSYVRKPLLAREGANVTVVQGGEVVAKTTGDYGEEGFVYQALYELPDFDGHHPVLGSWIVGGESAGMGIREGGLITGNTGRFVPHAFEK